MTARLNTELEDPRMGELRATSTSQEEHPIHAQEIAKTASVLQDLVNVRDLFPQTQTSIDREIEEWGKAVANQELLPRLEAIEQELDVAEQELETAQERYNTTNDTLERYIGQVPEHRDDLITAELASVTQNHLQMRDIARYNRDQLLAKRDELKEKREQLDLTRGFEEESVTVIREEEPEEEQPDLKGKTIQKQEETEEQITTIREEEPTKSDEEQTVKGGTDLEGQISELEASLGTRYLTGTGLNRAANRERLQLINLNEQLELHNHDHLPETKDPNRLADRIVERENIIIRARNARTQLNADINVIGGSILTATTAAAIFGMYYISNMLSYGS